MLNAHTKQGIIMKMIKINAQVHAVSAWCNTENASYSNIAESNAALNNVFTIFKNISKIYTSKLEQNYKV